ncbi:ribonuclease H2 subunit B, partial [Tremellales sp. Uapishka_1]
MDPTDVDTSAEHRYLRLPHPRTGEAQLYLPYVSTITGKEGILEVVKVNGGSRRTWFIGEDKIDAGSILIHHEIDVLFLVIPIVLSMISTTPTPFQPLSDLISQATTSKSFLLSAPFSTDTPEFNEDVSRLFGLKAIRRVMRAACEKKVVPPVPPSPPSESGSSSSPSKTVYYRPSMENILKLLRSKVEYFSQNENVDRFDHLQRALGRDGLLGTDVNEELVRSARIKASIEHFAQWLPASAVSSLNAFYDFTALAEHSANMTAAIIAASAPSVSKSTATKAAKRKAPPASRGVVSLKKVNTSSMNKLTSFFKPKENAESKKQ